MFFSWQGARRVCGRKQLGWFANPHKSRPGRRGTCEHVPSGVCVLLRQSDPSTVNLQQFLGRTNLRARTYFRFHYTPNIRPNGRIVQVREIPRDDEIHAIDCRDSYVKRVFRVFRRYAASRDNTLCKETTRVRHFEHRKSRNGSEPERSLLGVAFRTLGVDKSRDMRAKSVLHVLPECVRDLLMAGHDQVAAGTGREVTHHRSFQVQELFHSRKCTAWGNTSKELMPATTTAL